MAEWRSRLRSSRCKEARSDDVCADARAGLASAFRQHARPASAVTGFLLSGRRQEVKKLPEQSKLKQAKLLRSRRRRERLALKRKTAERRERSRRNDLLPELVIDYVPIDEIRPPRRRTRKNHPNQIARIAASITEYGFNQPALVRKGRVIDGWLRVLAARELGLDRVPVIDCSHLAEPEPYRVQGIFQSWDTAYDIEEQHDFSVCSTWALSGKNCYLLDIYRAKLEFPDLQKAIYAQRDKWEAGLVIVENEGAGKSVAQNIRRDVPMPNHWLHALKPLGSKEDRASQQTPKFERGEVWLPKDAPWLRAFEEEILSFPHGKNDDQVDSVTQFLAALDTGQLLQLAKWATRR